MRIMPVASGSAGNCYIVTDSVTTIMIDCGVPVYRVNTYVWNEMMRMSDIKGVLVSHCHADHCKYAQALADKGRDVYASHGTIEAAGLSGHRVHEIGAEERIGSFRVFTFYVQHDAPDSLGFVVCSDFGSRLLYVTDTPKVPVRVDGVTHLMIEANYDPEIITGNAESGAITHARAARTLYNHMSIGETLKEIQRMDKSSLKEVWLLHLSDDNASENFKQRVQEITGVEVYIA